ncbi:hypothetical protein BDW62DRAFT_202950 [Aspergillus aurantiobrunneus]
MVSITETPSPAALNGNGHIQLKADHGWSNWSTTHPHHDKEEEPSHKLVHALVERQAARMPHAVAVQFETTTQVTYHQLNELSNYLARQLVCGRGSIIPIFMERSINLIIALLAVLKTGASYTLIAAESPAERTRLIVEDTKAPFVLVDGSTQGRSGTVTEIPIENIVSKASWAPPKYLRNLNVHQSPSEIAYVIYTSGSTGRPKGVLLSHRAAATGLLALPLPKEPQTLRQLLCHSPPFSAAQRTIFGTLSRGGVLCLASKENVTSGLRETVESLGISSLEITPSMLHLLDPADLPPSVTRVVLGGEVAGPALVEAWADKVELYNGFGLSEVTQLNMRCRIFPGQEHGIIGKPSDSTTCYILRPGTLSPAPVDEPGELCLGGDQIAEGYLNMLPETQRTFVPNIFGRGRLCRTGDIVVLRADGTMQHIGRTDQQIKIDGQRVEPNESNAVIQRQPGVAQSSVVAASIRGRKALVAAIVPDEEAADWKSLVGQSRRAVRKRLQAYAVPRYWVRMETLPVNSNNKTDVKGLVRIIESMDGDGLIGGIPDQSNGTDGPLDPDVREMLAQVLAMVPERLSSMASFQDLGGSSLDAIVATSRARSIGFQLSVPDLMDELPIHQVFARPRAPVSGATKPPEPFALLPDGVALSNPVDVEDAYPVTPLQEGILADSVLRKANHVYQRVYKIQGGATVDRVKEVLDAAVQKYPILRTVFKPWKRSFIQEVKRSVTVPWQAISSGEDWKTALRRLQGVPMEINEPLVRATVVSSEYLILEMHHSLFDYWSSQFIFTDMVALLQQRDPVPRTRFSAYVAYQQSRSRDMASRSFWQQFLAAAPDTLLDLSGPQLSDHRFSLSANLDGALQEYSQASRITMATAVHQGWALTMARAMSRTDILFMTAASGRDADVDGILALHGPTLCTVPFRGALQDSMAVPVSTHGKQVQKALWDVAQHGHMGFRHAMATASLKPSALNTMINVVGKLENVDASSPLAPVMAHGDNYTQYITLEIDESRPHVAKLLVPFAADVSAAQSLLDTFVRTVKQMAADPQVSVGQLLSAELPEEPFGLAHAAFERCAAAEPHRPAIRTKRGELSYGDFNRRAECFASHLRRRGVCHGEMVPLYMDKSEYTLAAIFGILKAGAAFVPLDSHNPHERNKFIITDTSARLIVTDSANRKDCESFGLPMVLPEDIPLEENVHPGPVPELGPDSAAYVIFTSGSTGTPKGVVVPHSAVDAATRGMIQATQTTKQWVSLWVLNYIFDASYYDVFTVLSTGAVLCVAPQDDILSDLTGHINDLGVEQVMLTPTITKLIRGGPAEVPRLKVLNVCGEKIDTNILEWAKSVDVYNGYGPTEATILMTVSKVEPDGNLNSIGCPLKHVSAVILPAEDITSLEPVPDGQVGELCVRGPQLAHGYLNQPGQTAKVFIRDADGERIYRTGDLAKWAEDGSLLCLGRKDYQVKLNGFRIELGEIENAILHTKKVEAAVVSVAEVHRKRQLVAFCIFHGDQKPGACALMEAGDRREAVEDLQNSLTSLAHYMMPTLFLPFRNFPTLASGKANRKHLVELVQTMDPLDLAAYLPSAEQRVEFVPVSTDEERVMRKAWAAVFDVDEESIGASSLFASLGGDSIAAISISALCRSHQYGISVAQLLAHATLAEQATCLFLLERKVADLAPVVYAIPASLRQAIQGQPGLSQDDIEDIHPCGPGQVEFLVQGSKQEQFWNLTTSRLLPVDFDLDKWKEVTRRLTAANPILRSFYYQADEAAWYQARKSLYVLNPVVLRAPMLDWEERTYGSEEEKTGHVAELRDGQFEFGKPAVKYLLLRSQLDASRTLCIKVDHASYDGTLLRIFDEQFQAMASGDDTIPVPVPFKDYIDWVQREDRQEHLNYWSALLASYSPSDGADHLPAQPVSNSLRFFPLGVEVDAVADSFAVTPSTLFQAAYALVAGRLTKTTDVLVDNLITGRNAGVMNPQQLNGTCANFLPFRTTLDAPSMPASEFLKEVQSAFWESTEHGAVGLGDIYDALGWDREAAGAKLLFCFQPFDPVPPGTAVNHMRWVVMAQSKVFMTVNYALMVEVQKTPAGYRLKMQWDRRAFDEETIARAVRMFEQILSRLGTGKDVEVGSLLS